MRVVLYSADLMLMAIVDGAAKGRGVQSTAVNASDAAVEACGGGNRVLLVLDLRSTGREVETIVPAVRQSAPSAWIMACGPHVHEASLARAEAAGCDEVVTRGQFAARLHAAIDRLIAVADDSA